MGGARKMQPVACCPRCGSKQIGKVATWQYYCWNCFIEFSVAHGKLQMFSLTQDGALIDFDLRAFGNNNNL